VGLLVEFIEADAGSGKSFFADLPFTAVHISMQALQKHEGGWAQICRVRAANLVLVTAVPIKPMASQVIRRCKA
tara:strand:+ start:49 stop:270 length:222 start_codon:yes stop_codon:yes gene_type:complete